MLFKQTKQEGGMIFLSAAPVSCKNAKTRNKKQVWRGMHDWPPTK